MNANAVSPANSSCSLDLPPYIDFADRIAGVHKTLSGKRSADLKAAVDAGKIADVKARDEIAPVIPLTEVELFENFIGRAV
ncbi:MAG: hypothetical protein K0B16_04365 [Burkholderiaceae bacterium]|nr:hypothetical protein [Burkholderiaceae bacterium]